MNEVEDSLKEKILEMWEDDDPQIEVIRKGQWIADYKYEEKETIVKYDERWYSINESRTGSHFTDYDYQDSTVYEVVPVEVKRIEWRVKS